MVILIGLPLLAFILTLIYFISEFDSVGLGVILGILIAILTFVLSSLMTLGISSVVCSNLPQEEYISNTEYLQAFKDTSQIEGSMSGFIFVKSGHIEDKMVYRYIVETDKGLTFKSIDIESTNVYIKYTDDKPKIETISKQLSTKKGYMGWFSFDCISGNKVCTIFYVPKGSVTNEFNVDLE